MEEDLVVQETQRDRVQEVELEGREQDVVEVTVVVLGRVQRTVQMKRNIVPDELAFLFRQPPSILIPPTPPPSRIDDLQKIGGHGIILG